MPGTTSWPPRPPLEPLLFSSVFLLSCELLRLLRKWIGIEVVAAEVTDREEGVLTRCIAFGFQRVEDVNPSIAIFSCVGERKEEREQRVCSVEKEIVQMQMNFSYLVSH
ncbi:uncharacterized protein LOC127739782 isoform X1 [Arachis duranensis]|uniref:Uncharacterized protein LOC127739782 isoform X1 n=1 Tax=Arachis duranensis TaxID=130453 RepID=A0A9C6T4T6_ARADU|nr:uncharacterized protein LOC127739782 isoform X1 [Arachis duranensis]